MIAGRANILGTEIRKRPTRYRNERFFYAQRISTSEPISYTVGLRGGIQYPLRGITPEVSYEPQLRPGHLILADTETKIVRSQ